MIAALALVLIAADPTPAAPAFAACATAPKGMACVPGGPAVVGSDDAPNEKPKRTVQLSTFYVDAKEATYADWEACAKEQACAPLKGKAEEAVVGVDYPAAVKFCTWAGKRLPSEWEWEKAARGAEGDAAVWSVELPKGCKPGSQKKECAEAQAKPVASSHFGLFDLGGNFEWTSSWLGILGHKKVDATPDPNAAPDAVAAKAEIATIPRTDKDPCQDCEGVDPRGPCDGEMPCVDSGQKKIQRGGGWLTGKIGASHRRSQWMTTAQGAAVRCASTSPELTRFPAKVATEKRAKPAVPAAPSAEQLKQFADVTEDKLDTQVCEKKGRAYLDCRDPNSYIKSNEPRQQVWRPYVENLGGGYTGVGIDQNYTFIAAARSEWAWLFDYDPTVVRLHWILRAVILQSADRGSFVDHFSAKRSDETLKLLDDAYKDNPELGAYKEIYKISRASLEKYYQRQLTGEGGDPTFGWLATDDNYGYIRTLYQQGRIRAFKGNMLASSTMQGIGAAAKKMGVSIRIYYPSNAPECWPFTKEYKDNVLALPFDRQTIVLQTISGLAPGYMKMTGHWHYNVQAGLMQQELIRRKGTVLAKQLMEIRNRTQDPDLTITGLVGAFGELNPRVATKKGEATRERIYESALALFAARGYEDTTMRAIADGAGTSLGLAYRYFKRKDDIVLELYRRTTAAFAVAVASWAPSAPAPVAERLRAALLLQLDLCLPHRAVFAAVVPLTLSPRAEAFALGQSAADIRAQVVAAYCTVIGGGSDVEGLPSIESAALLCFVLQLAVLFYWLHDTSEGQTRTRALIDVVKDALHLGLGALMIPEVDEGVQRLTALLVPLFGPVGVAPTSAR